MSQPWPGAMERRRGGPCIGGEMRAQRLLVAVASIAAVLVFALAVIASITTAAGEVHKSSPPASVALNQHEQDDNAGNPSGAHAFNEELAGMAVGGAPFAEWTSAVSGPPFLTKLLGSPSAHAPLT